MPSLRDYRDRISSVKSTRKITSAMKMVAASKLRRTQEQAEKAQPYARAMAKMMARVAQNVDVFCDSNSPLLKGTGSDKRHLLVIVTADRGLCGGFNANLLKTARQRIMELESQGKEVFILCAGKKGRDILSRSSANIWQSFIGLVGKKRMEFAQANKVTQFVLDKFKAGEFDVCSLIYNQFESVLTQTPVTQQIIPFKIPETITNAPGQGKEEGEQTQTKSNRVSPYAFEPTEEDILKSPLPRTIGIQIFQALLDSAAGEQAARMTAMDNATRNAGDMIDNLSLQYNRARQAYITKELIEIISGAEAV